MSDTRNSLRDYGPNLPTPRPLGVPEWSICEEGANCPNCGARLCTISVKVGMEGLEGKVGTCRYRGCPACEYASPSVTESDYAETLNV